MLNAKLSKLLFAGLVCSAGAVQAAAPSSVSEVPPAWYADQIRFVEPARGAANPVFPTAAYEHGSYDHQYVETKRTRTEPSIAGRTIPFPSSPNESGGIL